MPRRNWTWHYCGCPDRDGDGYGRRVDAYPDDEFDGQIQMEMDMQTARMSLDEAGTSSGGSMGDVLDRDGDGFQDENDEDPNDAEVTVTPGLVRTALNQQGSSEPAIVEEEVTLQ